MALIKRNVQLSGPDKVSSWRKTAIGTWGHPSDPSIYGFLELDVRPALDFIAKTAKASGEKITLTHFTGKVMAEVCKRHPYVNRILRFGKLYSRTSIDIFYLVATDFEGEDLSGITIREADKKSLSDIAKEMNTMVADIRENGDKRYEGAKKTIDLLPSILSRLSLQILGFILYRLNLWHPILGCPQDPFGSIMLTSIGSLNLEAAFAPLVPYSHSPVMITIGAAMDAPVVKDNQVAVGKIMRLAATIDHRVIDGIHASHVAKTIRAIFANPEKELGASV